MLAPVGRESNLRTESILVGREGILTSSFLAPDRFRRCHHPKPRSIQGWAARAGSCVTARGTVTLSSLRESSRKVRIRALLLDVRCYPVVSTGRRNTLS